MNRDEFDEIVKKNPEYAELNTAFSKAKCLFEKIANKDKNFNKLISDITRDNCSWPFYEMALLHFVKSKLDDETGKGEICYQPSQFSERFDVFLGYKARLTKARKFMSELAKNDLTTEQKKILEDYKKVAKVLELSQSINNFLNEE